MSDPSEASSSPVRFEDIEGARGHVGRVATRTPIFNSRFLSEHVGSTVVYKAENLQRTGSFKVRGAYLRIARLTEAGNSRRG